MSENGKLVGRDAFHAARNRRYVTVQIANFGQVRFQSLTAKEKDLCESAAYNDNGDFDPGLLSKRKTQYLLHSIVGCDGRRYFSNSDAELLGGIDSGVADEMFAACIDHVLQTTAPPEVLEKNSEATAGADSQ